MNFPKDRKPPGWTEALIFVIVADDAFALKNNIMKPYSNRGLTKEQRIYNYRLSRARRVVENAFGILCSRFRIFGKPIALSPEKCEIITMASCCLHNFLLRNTLSASVYAQDHDQDGCKMNSLVKQGSNHASKQALVILDYF